tara:strand:+ start:53161 stop:53304 length:144 start_codon:yes stop_codon:yes gene_type:complete
LVVDLAQMAGYEMEHFDLVELFLWARLLLRLRLQMLEVPYFGDVFFR